MANYTQPSPTLPSTSSAYLDERGRQIAMSIYNPLFRGDTKNYISYGLMGVTAYSKQPAFFPLSNVAQHNLSPNWLNFKGCQLSCQRGVTIRH